MQSLRWRGRGWQEENLPETGAGPGYVPAAAALPYTDSYEFAGGHLTFAVRFTGNRDWKGGAKAGGTCEGS